MWRAVIKRANTCFNSVIVYTPKSKPSGVSVRDYVCMHCQLSLGISDTTAKLETVINHNENKQCEGDGETTRKHLSRELEIFEAKGETIKNIKLLLNAINIIPQLL